MSREKRDISYSKASAPAYRQAGINPVERGKIIEYLSLIG